MSKIAAPAEPGTMQIVLTAEQGNLVIAALAECPFKLVYELIGKLNRQANDVDGQAIADKYPCALTADELKLVLHALGNLPYHQVHALVHVLQQQLQAGLTPVAAAPKKSPKGPR
ncbi:hypothetical protein SAMN04515620_11123 [Collimonas sp. OK607]|uniref:hypothetical protein n=1 Tax=Collimonas sp. OK607 TaxID=1798194 RepID=UPI0008E1EDD0|nr:hypothetical protein [Collimonas sp. OK607]SFA98829.1 hypothetical protein SAMN04515620_11123 [Collimonas sp. OK607]